MLFWKCHNLAQNHPNPQDLLLMMATELIEIDAARAENESAILIGANCMM